MLYYILRRLLLFVPTLWAIITMNFFVIQLAPGGPVDQFVAKIEGNDDIFMERIGSQQSDFVSSNDTDITGGGEHYIASRGLSEDTLKAINTLYGFDKPLWERYVNMLISYLKFDFGESLFKASSVIDLIKNALPISISLGLWSTLVVYFVSIPLGVARAMRAGSKFDLYSGVTVVIGSAIPGFLFAMLLIVLFAGGSYWQIFPIRGLHSLGYESLPLWEQIVDYFHHLFLPILSMTIGGFAGLTLFTRNSFLDELTKQYVDTAKAKGLDDKAVLYKHVFRNAMLIIISGLPGAFIGIFFTGSLLIETIFSLNGIGLIGFEATMQRDYSIMFATLYIFTLIGLLTSLIGDITMMFVDPRIDFASRKKA